MNKKKGGGWRFIIAESGWVGHEKNRLQAEKKSTAED